MRDLFDHPVPYEMPCFDAGKTILYTGPIWVTEGAGHPNHEILIAEPILVDLEVFQPYEPSNYCYQPQWEVFVAALHGHDGNMCTPFVSIMLDDLRNGAMKV